MIQTLMYIQAIVSVLLILVVLVQFGKGAEAGLMGGNTETVFTSSQQGNILSKITIGLSIIFLGLCVYLARLQGAKSNASLLDSEAPIAAPLNSDSLENNKASLPKTETKPLVKEKKKK
jgi:preprotein translocase subunit SecG